MTVPLGGWRDWLLRFVLHVATGGLAVAAHYALMAAMLFSGAAPVVASSTGFAGGALVRFVSAYYKVFSPTSTVMESLPRFFVALGLQFVLNIVILMLLMNIGLEVWWAQVVTTIVLTFGNYLVYRLWVFR